MNKLAVAVLAAGSLQAAGLIVVGTDDGQVAVIDKSWPTRPMLTLRPFGERTPVYVAAGLDHNNDGSEDFVVGTGAGQPAEVKIFDLSGGILNWFTPPFPAYAGVRVAVGDVNNDGAADIVTAAGPGVAGGPVIVFDGASLTTLYNFQAYGASFTGGVYVAAGDINGDGYADIITGAGPGGGPHVKVFSGATGLLHASFLAYEAGFTGGVRVASTDFDGDGTLDVITGAGPGAAGGHVKVFDGATFEEHAQFFSFDQSYLGGVFVASGSAAVTPGQPSGGVATVRIFDPTGNLQWLMPFPSYTGGLTLGSSWGLMSRTPARPRLPGKK